MPKLFSDPEAIAEDIIRDVGTNLVVGLPLGLGKANHIINALYARAAADRSINLTLFSALTLEKPKPANLLERRFIAPVIDRLFGGYPDLAYAAALHAGALAAQHQGDRVLLPGGKVAARAVRAAALYFRQLYPCRVLSAGARAQRRHPTGGEARRRRRHALQPELQHRHHAGYPARPRARARASFKLVGQVNSELPFMPGAGDLPADEFSAVLDSPETDFPLFAPPSEPISDTKYAIGLHAAGLVRDGGTLQIGIGQVGDALAQGLIVRHRDNAQFHAIMKRLAPGNEQLAALETGAVRKGSLWRQRNAVRGVSRPDRGRHSQARGRWRGAARRVFSRAEIVLSRACAR